MLCNGVFQGGGVKGIGFVGAIRTLENAGYRFETVAGTSVGSIVAALIASGYTGKEIQEELLSLDYKNLMGNNFLTRNSNFLKTFNLITSFGMYSTNLFEKYIEELLIKKGVKTFKDLSYNNDSRFYAIASDITSKEMLVLPSDLYKFGIDGESFSVARAVAMSIALPFYFKPIQLNDGSGKRHLILDGGLLSNYPIWLLDGKKNFNIPTFGFKFGGENLNSRPRNFDNNIIGFTKSIISTLMGAWDNRHISESKGDFARTILIPTTVTSSGRPKKVNATEFDITKTDKLELLKNGTLAAEKFLDTWDFETWKKRYIY